ncbi:DUF2799 domain-containing protein [Chitinilyticum aquatile]|uniref:DUF2799 domain-containing protein n=1 Tax=Chitinilyticum aquatile TaxID=362520 RepID=UPI00040BD56A|nr:DUF2799 domain-containing protein [Chitinilyticum aquatile]
MKTALLVLSALCLSGCAALTESECRVGDWYGLGLRDGQQGRTSQIAAYYEACRDLGVKPLLADYNRGRNQGLLAYCTPENGYRVGLAGDSDNAVCPAALQPAFQRAHERGRQRYLIVSEISSLEYEQDRLDRERWKLEERIARADKEDERRHLLSRLRSIQDEQRRDQRRMESLRYQLDNLQYYAE